MLKKLLFLSIITSLVATPPMISAMDDGSIISDSGSVSDGSDVETQTDFTSTGK